MCITLVINLASAKPAGGFSKNWLTPTTTPSNTTYTSLCFIVSILQDMSPSQLHFTLLIFIYGLQWSYILIVYTH